MLAGNKNAPKLNVNNPIGVGQIWELPVEASRR